MNNPMNNPGNNPMNNPIINPYDQLDYTNYDDPSYPMNYLEYDPSSLNYDNSIPDWNSDCCCQPQCPVQCYTECSQDDPTPPVPPAPTLPPNPPPTPTPSCPFIIGGWNKILGRSIYLSRVNFTEKYTTKPNIPTTPTIGPPPTPSLIVSTSCQGPFINYVDRI